MCGAIYKKKKLKRIRNATREAQNDKKVMFMVNLEALENTPVKRVMYGSLC